jgi:hypothetical protein
MVPTATSSIGYAGNNSTSVAYAVPFKFFKGEHLSVTVTSVLGVVTPLALTSGFTVTGAGADEGGALKTVAAVPASSSIKIVRNTPMVNLTDWSNAATWRAETLEANFDYLIMAAIDAARRAEDTADRALMVPPGETVNDVPSDRALSLLGFDVNKQPIAITTALLTDAAALQAVLAEVTAASAAIQAIQDLKRFFIDCDSAFLPLLRAGVRGETSHVPWFSDSTWRSQSGIPYNFGVWWANEFPNFRVEYRVPNAGSDGFDLTVLQAGPLGRQHWHFNGGAFYGPAMPSATVAEPFVGTTTEMLTVEADWSPDAVNGSGWPTATHYLGGWGSGSQRSYFYISSTGRLGFDFYNGSTIVSGGTSTNQLPALTAGTFYMFRCEVIADNGAGGYSHHYQYSTNGGVTWNSLSGGTPQTQATATVFGDPGGTWFIWLGGWGNNATPGAKSAGFQIYLGTGTERRRLLPSRVDWFQLGDGQTAAGTSLGGSPTLFIDNISSSGSGVTRSTHWLVAQGGDYLFDNKHALIIDRGPRCACFASTHNDYGSNTRQWSKGMDTLKETALLQYGTIPKCVIFTQNPESAAYGNLSGQHARKQADTLAYAAASGDAAVDTFLMITEEEDYDEYIEPGGVHPNVPDGYALMTTKFNAGMKTLKDTLAS